MYYTELSALLDVFLYIFAKNLKHRTPDPTNGNIDIPLPESVPANARILLFDAGGGKCLDSAVGQEGNLIRLDTDNLTSSGLYLYRIVASNRTVSEGKFVKD